MNTPAVWMTGLPASGKTSLSEMLHTWLRAHGWVSQIVDGDDLRRGVSQDLGYSRVDRIENMRRAAVLAKSLIARGVFPVVALVSPIEEGRRKARSVIGEDFVEVYVRCPLAVCMMRDPKGLYRRARAGELKGVTGLDDVYEPPLRAEIVVDTDLLTPSECIHRILDVLRERAYLQCPKSSA